MTLNLGPIRSALQTGDPVPNRPWLSALITEIDSLRAQLDREQKRVELAWVDGYGAGREDEAEQDDERPNPYQKPERVDLVAELRKAIARARATRGSRGCTVTLVLAVDPGNQDSAYCVVDSHTRRPVVFGKWPNESMRGLLAEVDHDVAAIEMVRSYGMSVGHTVFETCVWVGRFTEILIGVGTEPQLVERNPVKLHLCGTNRATDANIRQALIDRFAPNTPNRGKGTKAQPGWFHGVSADVWSAYALAVYVADEAAA